MMDNKDQNKQVGDISRLLKEKAKQGFEFGKSSRDPGQKDTIHIEQPKSNHKGIDRGRWAD
jgi:hypothetical protein